MDAEFRTVPGRMQAARETGFRQHVQQVKGGTPITESTAIALRRIVFGQCPSVIRAEFFSQGPGLVFRVAERDLGYALTIGSTVTSPIIRAILMVIQAHILKVLLFEPKPKRIVKPSPLMPTYMMQQEALVSALTEIIWKAGGGQSCVLCLPNTSISHLSDSEGFNQDGVTEKLHLFAFSQRLELQQVVRRYCYIFQEDPSPAILLLIYSAVLSRGIERIGEDLGSSRQLSDGFSQMNKNLLCYAGDINFGTLSLLLTGRASPFLHNGVEYREDNRRKVEETGVLIRSPIGLLIWMRTEDKTANFKLGSRLKTPVFPIWLVIAVDQTGILFSDDRELLRNYHAENRFRLHYFTSSHHQMSSVVLGIDNRMNEDTEEVPFFHTLEKIIRTKWSGARIKWNGLTPFI